MSGAIHAFTMPKWGLTMEKGTLTGWHKAVGDRVEPGMEICDVETEKIANAVESPVGGVLRRLVASQGDMLPVGALLAVIADPGVPESEIDAAVARFQASYVPPAAGAGESAGPKPEYIEIAGRRVRHLIQRGTGDAVVMVHGFGGNLENWLMNQAALAGGGRTVAALDLPGHGESSKQLESGSLEELSSIVLAYMDAVGIESAHLVGHSMGAAVCLLLADRARPRVKSLALIAPAGLGQSINREYIQGFVAAANHRQLKPLMHLLFADERLVTRQLVEEALRYKRLEGVGEALTKIATNRFGETSTGGQLRDVVGCVPTLIIWGGRDRVIPAPTAAEFSGPDVVFRVLPEHGHMVQIEAAAEVNRLIEAHLAR